jgi:hypothetical protein
MKPNENIVDEETKLCFNLTNIDGNHGYYILNVTIGVKNSDDGYSSASDAKKAAHDRCKEIMGKKTNKTIYVYDPHFLGMLSALVNEFEGDGNTVINIDTLEYVRDHTDSVIIHPLSEVMADHSENIKEFITKNRQTKIILTSPTLYKEQVEKILGKHEHVKIFDQKQFDNSEDIFGEILEELYR